MRCTLNTQETKGKSPGSLIVGGANGGFGGDDVLIVAWGDRTINATGMKDHTEGGIPIVTCIGLLSTTTSPVIAVFHQYAYLGIGKTIHSSTQLRHFGHDINNISIKSPCGTGK